MAIRVDMFKAGFLAFVLLLSIGAPLSSVAASCGIKPIKPISPIGCVDVDAQCVCGSGGNCSWNWVCVEQGNRRQSERPSSLNFNSRNPALDAYRDMTDHLQRERAADQEYEYQQERLRQLRSQKDAKASTGDPRFAPLLDGKPLSEETEQIIKNTLFQSLELSVVGDVRPFSNPQRGTTGTVIILAEQESASGKKCRDFRISLSFKAQTKSMDSTACSNGSEWVWGMK